MLFNGANSIQLAQISATILAGLLANPTLTDGDKELNWEALCEDADQAARHLLERAERR